MVVKAVLTCPDENMKGRLISHLVLLAYSVRILSSANIKLLNDRQTYLKFSHGSYMRFMERHNLRGGRVHGECGIADREAIGGTIQELLGEVKNYTADDVWNADEFGVFYRQAPKSTISSAAVEGRKVEKSRSTCLACWNRSGKQTFPLMIIGKREQPRVFHKSRARNLVLTITITQKHG